MALLQPTGEELDVESRERTDLKASGHTDAVHRAVVGVDGPSLPASGRDILAGILDGSGRTGPGASTRHASRWIGASDIDAPWRKTTDSSWIDVRNPLTAARPPPLTRSFVRPQGVEP